MNNDYTDSSREAVPSRRALLCGKLYDYFGRSRCRKRSKYAAWVCKNVGQILKTRNVLFTISKNIENKKTKFNKS